MSNISCNACNDLREYAPNFVQNGVDSTVATSLLNGTGLNPSLAVTHSNCEDMKDVIDCLIGRMTDELEAYDVCDWKDFNDKFMSNLYETLKAMVMNECRIDLLCASIDNILLMVTGGWPQYHTGTFTERGRQIFVQLKDDFVLAPVLAASIYDGAGCTQNKRLGRWGLTVTNSPRFSGFTTIGAQSGDIYAFWRKEDIVPMYMTEFNWNRLMQGDNLTHFNTFGGDQGTDVYVRVRGYIVMDGVARNEDLKDEFGPDVLVAEYSHLVGASSVVTAFADGGHDIHSYIA